MKNVSTRVSKRSARALLALAGAAAVVTAGSASAIVDSRTFVRWSSIANRGAQGSSVVIGSIEGGQPLASHQDLRNTISLQFSWPFGQSPNIDQPIFDRNWTSVHATATASALVGQGVSFGDIRGMAPSATLITGSFATGLDNNGNLENNTITSFAFPMFAIGHQPTADAVADALGIPRYQAASVLSLPFGSRENGGRSGEDSFSRVANAVASMADLTIVSAAGDDGEMDMSGQDLMTGSLVGPGSAHNTIAVGRLDEENEQLSDLSSVGPQVAIEWGVAAMLFPKMPSDPKTMFPTEADIEGARPGPDIIAPGTQIRLSGSPASPVDSETAFSDFWTGTSFSSAIVAGAAALVHDLGNQEDLWPEGRPSGLLTRALLLNSASKDDDGLGNGIGFDNGAQTGEPPSMMNPDDESEVLITMQALDEELGAGVLNLSRLVQQFSQAKFKDYTNLEGFTFRPGPDGDPVYDVPTLGTDPDVPFVTTESSPFGIGIGSRLGVDRPELMGPPHAPLAVANVLGEWSDSPRAELLQFGPDPDILDPDGGGDNETRPVPFPDFPAPGGDGPGGGGPFGPSFRSGWDLGNIGDGEIDIPMGVVTPGSDITATLVWHRLETWNIPDFAAPLAQIDPSTTVTIPSANRAAARAANKPAATNKTLEGPREIYNNVSIISADEHCGRPIRMPQGVDPADLGLGRNLDHHEQEAVENYQRVMDRVEQFKRKPTRTVGADVGRGEGGGLDIVYQLSGAVEQNQEFVEALEEAAAIWESFVNDDITVTMAVDFADSNFLGPTTIAGTFRSSIGFSYADVRSMLINNAAFAELTLLNQLPNNMIFQTAYADPISSTAEGFAAVAVSQANTRALGFALPPNVPGFDSFIVFNTDFMFDNDPSDGVPTGQVDTVYVMAHEIGHALGFVSGVDDISREALAGLDPLIAPSPLDFFRFSEGSPDLDPNTLSDFRNFDRLLDFDRGPVALDTVDAIQGVDDTYQFSRGIFTDYNGDGIPEGRQASHWLDDLLFGGAPIGIMDPTININGSPPVTDPLSFYISQADKLAFSLIGWDIQIGTASDSVPVITFPGVNGPGTTPVPGPLIEFSLSNLDMELFRRDFGGFGNVKVAASRTTFNNVEHIFIEGTDDESGAGAIPFGEYFLRLIFENTRYDFGGYLIPDTGGLGTPEMSEPLPNFIDVPRAQVKYALAWFIDLERTQQEFVEEGGSDKHGDLTGDGIVDAADLASLLSNYGNTGGVADLNDDGVVDSYDLADLLGNFEGR